MPTIAARTIRLDSRARTSARKRRGASRYNFEAGAVMIQRMRPGAVPGFCVLYSNENGMGMDWD
ncbi:hypothetical protein GCM10022626_20020 [[Pseudomonas] carboxydohydrogena]